MFDYDNNKLIKIKIVLNQNSNLHFYDKLFSWLNNYLNISTKYVYITSENEENLTKNIIFNADFCFVDFSILNKNKTTLLQFSSLIRQKNNQFRIVFILNKFTQQDFLLFKNGADDIIYCDKDLRNIKWKFLSILRRCNYSNYKNFILIKNDFYIDIIRHKVIVNEKEVCLTKKEFQLLSILVEEFNKEKRSISKQRIFNLLYSSNGLDNTRVVDQLIFRLKNKLGRNNFLIENKGIKII